MTNATWDARSTVADERDEKLDRLYQLIEDIEVAMLTTRRRDGSLVSRPMATQRRAEGAHFWFVTEEGSPKIDEIVLDPNVNLSYYKARTKEWVSVRARRGSRATGRKSASSTSRPGRSGSPTRAARGTAVPTIRGSC